MSWLTAFGVGVAIGVLVGDGAATRQFERWLNKPDTHEWLLECWGVEREKHQFTYTSNDPTITSTWTATSSL
jgi:hypothetical protein